MARTVLILGFEGVQALDLVGPFEVFTGASMYVTAQGLDEGYAVRVVSVNGVPVSTGAPVSRCGFGSAETLRRNFVRRLGISPDQYRKTFA